ncbi:hypothetical protein [Phaeocystidibacter luteus]|uniref:DUF4019 domain-containing protein n=1 Tax=Phaeocystidibacter luteus TaxID=911197 RepID=A0A6N6RKM2_9FLAO|nr:hypothetical protein [Phaeocystidibacter luteus]KAB2810390.1 hypothetical protein F8C67_07320 [Phaeocystidibacter luteus]
MHKYLLSLIALLTFVSCTESKTYLNRIKDRDAGAPVAQELLLHINDGEWDSATAMFADLVFDEFTVEQLEGKFRHHRVALGELEDAQLIDWQTKVVEGGSEPSLYDYEYLNTYENHTAVVLIQLLRKGEGPFEVYGYRVTSDAFSEEQD